MIFAEAFTSLGDIYKYSIGVEINYEKAFQWYSQAAECLLCDYDGQRNLGIMYYSGMGTEININSLYIGLKNLWIMEIVKLTIAYIKPIRYYLN
jgi:TPR repeat protein